MYAVRLVAKYVLSTIRQSTALQPRPPVQRLPEQGPTWEGSRVGDAGRRQQHVSHQLDLRHLQPRDRLAPALVLAGQAVDEAVGEGGLAGGLLGGLAGGLLGGLAGGVLRKERC